MAVMAIQNMEGISMAKKRGTVGDLWLSYWGACQRERMDAGMTVKELVATLKDRNAEVPMDSKSQLADGTVLEHRARAAGDGFGGMYAGAPPVKRDPARSVDDPPTALVVFLTVEKAILTLGAHAWSVALNNYALNRPWHDFKFEGFGCNTETAKQRRYSRDMADIRAVVALAVGAPESGTIAYESAREAKRAAM